MWVLLFNWDRCVIFTRLSRPADFNRRIIVRAFELALKHKTHADTVLYFRQRYLKNLGMKETNAKFSQYSEEVFLEIDFM